VNYPDGACWSGPLPDEARDNRCPGMEAAGKSSRRWRQRHPRQARDRAVVCLNNGAYAEKVLAPADPGFPYSGLTIGFCRRLWR